MGTVVQTSQTDQSTCLVHDLSFRAVKSGRDVRISMVGQVSSSREALDACKLYNISWYAQRPGASLDVVAFSEAGTNVHLEDSASCPHHILASMQDIVEKGTDALWMHSCGSLDVSTSPTGLQKNQGASGYMAWSMLRSVALECSGVECGGLDTSPLHPGALVNLKFSTKRSPLMLMWMCLVAAWTVGVCTCLN